MDVPLEVLEELKCSKCEAYLSRGPIYLQHDGAAACGLCFTSKNPATRNTQYEALARLARFPCKNRDLGCPTTVPFAKEAQEITHEEVCEYRQYVCPVLGSARCDWLGIRGEILQHCQEKHSDRILDNPCSLVHDITKSSLHNYLITAFQLLFLLHTKVCVTSGKIFHAVRFLGASEKVPEFNYTLDISRGDEKISRKGQVVGQGCLAIQEDTSLALNTNSLLDMLGGGDGISFILTLKRLKITSETCIKCNGQLTLLKYRDINGWHCENCVPNKRACSFRNKDCGYRDFDKKVTKHEVNFCNKRSRCRICNLSISQDTMLDHYNCEHSDITYITGTKWRIYPLTDWQNAILQTVAGPMICWYQLENSNLVFEVHSLIKTELLHEFECRVHFTQPSSKCEKTLILNASYDTDYDWAVEVKRVHFPNLFHEFDVVVDILKTDL